MTKEEEKRIIESVLRQYELKPTVRNVIAEEISDALAAGVHEESLLETLTQVHWNELHDYNPLWSVLDLPTKIRMKDAMGKAVMVLALTLQSRGKDTQVIDYLKIIAEEK